MASGRKGKSSVLVRILVALNLIALGALLVSYASLYIDPRTWWVPAFFGLSYPIILLMNLLFVIIWLLLWKRYIFLSLISIVAGYSLLFSIYPLQFSKTDPDSPEDLGIITYNIHAFSYQRDKNSQTKQQIREYIRKKKPDILCLQEFAIRADSFPVMKNVVGDLGFDHYIFSNYFDTGKRKITNGLLLASDIPIVATGSIKDSRKKTFTIYVDLLWKGDTIRIYNVHLASIHFAQTEYMFYETLRDPDVDNENFKEGAFKILRKLKDAFLFRAEQIELLNKQLKHCPYPVIFCGDFNDTPFSYSYQTMTARFDDAFKAAGNELFGTTYAGRLPSYRIDYVLYDKYFSATLYKKDEIELSDHYPVTVKLSTKKRDRGL